MATTDKSLLTRGGKQQGKTQIFLMFNCRSFIQNF